MRNIGIIILVVLCGFGVTLFNGFVGDDHVLFTYNTFYRHINNLPRIFSPTFVSNNDLAASSVGLTTDMDSGSVSFRPTAMIYYFIDYALFGLDPRGYHALNILWHLANCVLVYLILFYMTSNAKLGLLVALLFAVHPTKSEAVSVISFRNDLIVAFYLLMSFLLYVRFRKTGNQRKFYLGALLFFCLGVFAKEYAVVFPLLIFFYDKLFCQKSSKSWTIYLPFVVITGIYLWIYKFIVPSTAFGNGEIESIKAHLTNVGWLNVLYIRDIFFPWYAKIWPPQAMPAIIFSEQNTLILSALVLLIYIALIIYYFKKNNFIVFFMLWSFVLWLPVSDLIAKPNPISQRFYYLPSLGLIVVLVLGLMWFVERMKGIRILPSFGTVFYSSVVGMCLVFCVPLNTLWKSDFIIASYWLDTFPPTTKTLSIMGTNYLLAHNYSLAKEYFLKAYEINNNDFNTLMIMSKLTHKNPSESRQYLEKLLNLYSPNFLVYFGMGESYFLEKNYSLALHWFEKAINFKKDKNIFGMAILSSVYSGDNDKAKRLLSLAQESLNVEDYEFITKELNQIQNENPDLLIPQL